MTSDVAAVTSVTTTDEPAYLPERSPHRATSPRPPASPGTGVVRWSIRRCSHLGIGRIGHNPCPPNGAWTPTPGERGRAFGRRWCELPASPTDLRPTDPVRDRAAFGRPTVDSVTMGTIGPKVVLTRDQARAFLASPAGARFRRLLATGVIISVPLLFRIPLLRRHPLFRWLEALGGAALVIKAVEALRDWELDGGQAERIVIDVPPVADVSPRPAPSVRDQRYAPRKRRGHDDASRSRAKTEDALAADDGVVHVGRASPVRRLHHRGRQDGHRGIQPGPEPAPPLQPASELVDSLVRSSAPPESSGPIREDVVVTKSRSRVARGAKGRSRRAWRRSGTPAAMETRRSAAPSAERIPRPDRGLGPGACEPDPVSP